MTHKERILAFLTERPGLWFDDDELSQHLGIHPRQTVYTTCRHLADIGKIQRERRDGKIRNTASTTARTEERGPAVQERTAAALDVQMTPAQFERLAQTVVSTHYGTRLEQGTVSNVPKRFDLVAADGTVVGDAKFYTLVRGEHLPPAKFSVIAEHVWLLEKTGAKHKFLVFGNDRRVPEQWLARYGHLVDDVVFYFMSETGELDRLR